MGSPKSSDEPDERPAISADLQVVGSNPDCAVGILQNCVILCWRREIVQAGTAWARKAFVDVLRARPHDKVAFFTVVDDGCSLNTPAEVRNDLAALLKKYDAQLAGAAITFEGKGFKMTMVRSVITAINMASRSQFPNSVFSDIDSAGTWLSARAPSLRPAEIVSAVARLRGVKGPDNNV